MKYTDKNLRPCPHKPEFENIPIELKSGKQWILWKYVWKDASQVWTKVPFSTNGACADTTNPNTWSNFESVFMAYEQQQSKYDGIGFVFTDKTDIVGVDLDNCLTVVNNKVEVTPFALRVCEKLNTYTEVSPSMTGLHLIGRAKDLELIRKKILFKGNEIEVYKTGRYFTFTGCISLPALPIADIKSNLDDILLAITPKETPKTVKPETQSAPEVVTLNISTRLKMALKNEKVKQIFDGDVSNFGGDDSRADLALVRSLAYWSEGNREILDSMFRESKLMRPKWDEKRGHDTYGNITIDKVLADQTEFASFIKTKDKNAVSDYNSRKTRRVSVNDVWDSVMEYRESGDSRGVTTGWDNLTSLYRPAKGLFTVVTGLPGSGKSTFVDVLAFNIAKLHDWKFTFASFETLPMQRHILNFAQIATQKPTFKFIKNCATDDEMNEVKDFINDHFHFIMPSDDELSIDCLLDYVADDIKEYDIDGFILDPYTELDEKRGFGVTETEHIKQVLKSFQRFTRHNQIHSWLIAHPVKSGETYINGRPSLRSIAGSQNFYNKVDFGLVVHREEEKTKVFVDKVRFDINGKMGECEFDFDTQRKEYIPINTVEADRPYQEEEVKHWGF